MTMKEKPYISMIRRIECGEKLRKKMEDLSSFQFHHYLMAIHSVFTFEMCTVIGVVRQHFVPISYKEDYNWGVLLRNGLFV